MAGSETSRVENWGDDDYEEEYERTHGGIFRRFYNTTVTVGRAVVFIPLAIYNLGRSLATGRINPSESYEGESWEERE